jgi:hypothetical protein
MRPSLATFAALLALLATGAAIANASGKAVLNDCTDDERMSKTYSQQDYRDALDGLAADADQYGNCRDVIRRAMLAGAAPRNTGGKATKDSGAANPSRAGDRALGSAPAEEQLRTATAKERRALDRARNDATAPSMVDNATVDPAKVGRVPATSQASTLPTPIAVLLALLLAGLLALGAVRVRSLVHARRA